MIALSWSKIELLRTCPLAFRRRHIDRAPEAFSAPRAVGKTIHAWVEAVLRGKLDDDTALRLLRECIAPLPEEAGADAFQLGETVIRTGRLPSLPSDATGVQLEHRWARTVDGAPCDFLAPEALIRGITDLRFTENNGTLAAIRDWKTNHVAYDPNDQMRICSWAEVTASPQVKQVAASLHFLRSGAVRREVYDADELREMVPPMLLAIHADLQRREAENDWKPQVSNSCGHCDYRASCPAMQHEYTPLRVLDDEANARLAANQLAALQAQVKQLEEALRSYAREHGPIRIGNEHIGFLPKQKTEVVDAPRVFTALQTRGVPTAAIWAELKLGKAAAEKLAASNAPRGTKGQAKEVFVSEMIELGAMETRTTTEWKRAAIGAVEEE